MTNGATPACPACGLPPGGPLFCRHCHALQRTPRSGVRAASLRRRALSGAVDCSLFALSLGIGWLLCLGAVAPRGQSPGKALLHLYILNEDGTPASAGRVWARELMLPWLLVVYSAAAWGFLWGTGAVIVVLAGLLSFAVLGRFWLREFLAAIRGRADPWTADRQLLHDKVTGTLVVHAAGGVGRLALSPAAADPPRSPDR